MNIDKDLWINGMNLDNDILYNFTNASSQLMRDDGITPWIRPREKYSLFFQYLIDVFFKLEGIVADLTTNTCIKHFIFTLKLFYYVLFITDMFSFVNLLIIVCSFFDRTLYTCLPCFEASPLGVIR
jgi:hypothetical protein